MIKDGLLNDLVLHHISDVDSKDRYILSEGRLEEKGASVVSKIIEETWLENEDLRRKIDYFDCYDEKSRLNIASAKECFRSCIFVCDYNGEVYAYLNDCESVKIYDFWKLFKMFPRELANLFEWNYLELVDVESNTDNSFKDSIEKKLQRKSHLKY